jgi:hypothetical protein
LQALYEWDSPALVLYKRNTQKLFLRKVLKRRYSGILPSICKKAFISGGKYESSLNYISALFFKDANFCCREGTEYCIDILSWNSQ